MTTTTRRKFIALGFDTELINKIASLHQTVSGLQGQNKKALQNLGFSKSEIELITGKINRQPIEKSVLKSVLSKNGEVCCYCANGNSTQPFQIHHIIEYHLTHDNSEANLLLVCPTHHVLIHEKKLAAESQRFKKASWENTWAISKKYATKGISYPFNAFEQLDYNSPSTITDIFSFNAPSPSLCKELAQTEVAAELSKILHKENRVILSGDSGSGKTTLARGIAGLNSQVTTYNYTPGKDTSRSVSEILTFLSFTEKQIILVVDNATSWLSIDQIEQVLKAADDGKKIILIQTQTLSPSDLTLEKHFLRAFADLSWNRMKPAIVSNLLRHEVEVISYLVNNNTNSANRLGSGVHDRPFKYILEDYASTVKTVWQFLFLLSSGVDIVDNLQVKLYADERMDLVVLFIGIHQISQVENGVSVDQILSLFSWHSALIRTSQPSKEWILHKLEGLVNDRILTMTRGRYNTIHREFSIRVIEHFHFKCRKDTEELLNQIFKDFTRVKEIVILWSWLEDITARIYVQNWYQRLNLEQWKELINEASKDGLAMISRLARRMSFISIRGYLPIEVGFKDKGSTIVELMRQNIRNALSFTRLLFSALEHNAPDVIVEVLDTISFEEMATLIRQSDPTEFDSIIWLFNTIQGVYAKWIVRFSTYLRDNDFDVILDKIQRGDIDSLAAVVAFHRRYFANIKRSRFKIYTQKFASLLKGDHLEEIDCRALTFQMSAFLELRFYPSDMKAILEALDKRQLSKDFEQASPRSWGNLLELSFLTRDLDDKTINEIVNGINVDKLRDNVSLYYHQYLYELRLLLYQLSYGNLDKRKEFAAAFYPILFDLMAGKNNDENDVLKAYSHLDEDLGKALCRVTKIAIKEDPAVKPEDVHSDELTLQEQIDLAERSGEDYNMLESKFKL